MNQLFPKLTHKGEQNEWAEEVLSEALLSGIIQVYSSHMDFRMEEKDSLLFLLDVLESGGLEHKINMQNLLLALKKIYGSQCASRKTLVYSHQKSGSGMLEAIGLGIEEIIRQRKESAKGQENEALVLITEGKLGQNLHELYALTHYAMEEGIVVTIWVMDNPHEAKHADKVHLDAGGDFSKVQLAKDQNRMTYTL